MEQFKARPWSRSDPVAPQEAQARVVLPLGTKLPGTRALIREWGFSDYPPLGTRLLQAQICRPGVRPTHLQPRLAGHPNN
eukprot:5553297-Lingulodinium_polyedra.AAC.1